MNKKLLVSIIVPVYNVEKYIKKCIDSLIKQTYHNIEIIVINDGSPDNSIKIVKSIKDKRINIIEQKNMGVSAARNNGLDHAKGDYIVFVDSDDYLSENFVEYMLSLISRNNADFAFSSKNYINKNNKEIENTKEEILNSEDAVANLLSPDITVGCWNKIFETNFLKNNKLRFSEELFYGEGLQFIIDCSIKSKKVIKTNKKLYYYRKNNDTSATSKYNIKKIHNGEKSLKLLKDKIDIKNKKIKSMYILHLSTFYLGAIVKTINNKETKNYKDSYKYWKKQLYKNIGFIITSKYISLYRKIMLLVGTYFPRIIAYLDDYRCKKIIKNSVK